MNNIILTIISWIIYWWWCDNDDDDRSCFIIDDNLALAIVAPALVPFDAADDTLCCHLLTMMMARAILCVDCQMLHCHQSMVLMPYWMYHPIRPVLHHQSSLSVRPDLRLYQSRWDHQLSVWLRRRWRVMLRCPRVPMIRCLYRCSLWMVHHQLASMSRCRISGYNMGTHHPIDI